VTFDNGSLAGADADAAVGAGVGATAAKLGTLYAELFVGLDETTVFMNGGTSLNVTVDFLITMS
jgi:hypothetical protein